MTQDQTRPTATRVQTATAEQTATRPIPRLSGDMADQGIHPHTISTDMSTPGRTAIVFSLLECMAKFMAVGYSFEQVIRMTTANAARLLGMADEIGALAVGRVADITVLEVVRGAWQFRDCFGETFTGETALVPVHTIRAGELIAPEWGPHPWGWLPKSAER